MTVESELVALRCDIRNLCLRMAVIENILKRNKKVLWLGIKNIILEFLLA